MSKLNTGSASDLFATIEPYGLHFMLTKNSTLIGAIELSGRDPDGMVVDDHAQLCMIEQAIYGQLDRQIGITKYYSHFDGVTIQLKPRADVISNALSQRREGYLNASNMSGSRLIHYFEIDPDENLNKLNLLGLFKHLGLAVFEERSRLILKNSLSSEKMFLVELEQMERMASKLQNTISEVTSKWNGLFKARQLSAQEIWAHMRFLASLDPSMLANGLNEAIPEEDADAMLAPGDIRNVVADRMDVLKISGAVNTYVKLATVRRFSRKGGKLFPGLWAAKPKSPCRLSGNYVIMTQWRPMSELKKDLMFYRKNTELERASLKFFDLISGRESQNNLDKQAGLKRAIKDKIDELGIAEALPDVWGTGTSIICIFDTDPKKLRVTVTEMSAALGNARINAVWESISIGEAFAAFQPGNDRASNKKLNMPSSHFAAATLLYQSSTGQATVPDLQGEEAGYVLMSKDRTPFHFSTYINGRGMLIGVGPIRKGKTFLKNTLATHSQKYGAIYRAVDIDPGSEPIAGVFKGNAGIFRVSNHAEDNQGSNPFASSRGPDDVDFKQHLLSLLMLFLEANDAKEYQSITPDEQDALDAAISKTMRLPPEMQSLSSLHAHMPDKLKVKFSRWVRPSDQNAGAGAGWFAHLFDCEHDSIGQLNKPMGIFNLQALKETPKLLKPVMADILYRITKSFEDPDMRHVPKILDLDECHLALSLPGFPEYVDAKIRTWGKWFGSVQMWTQSVVELKNIPGWPALRSAASTFVFFSDPEMDEKLYREAFPFLTSGECEAIRNLVPQREAYIIQSEIGVSKVVVIDVEMAQRVVNTSHPREAAMRDALIRQHGFDKGLELAIAELTPVMQRDPDEDIHSLLTAA